MTLSFVQFLLCLISIMFLFLPLSHFLPTLCDFILKLSAKSINLFSLYSFISSNAFVSCSSWWDTFWPLLPPDFSLVLLSGWYTRICISFHRDAGDSLSSHALSLLATVHVCLLGLSPYFDGDHPPVAVPKRCMWHNVWRTYTTVTCTTIFQPPPLWYGTWLSWIRIYWKSLFLCGF